eukprot:4680800-Pleurochrysis_carterae.AAC.1
MSLAPTPHWSSSGRIQGEGAVMTGRRGAPSGPSGGVADGGGAASGLWRLRAAGALEGACEGCANMW